MGQVAKTLNTSAIELSNPDNMVDFAKDLAKFIKEQNLSQRIQGREYVNVEGWQYAGSRLGIIPIIDEVKDISTETEIKYQVRVFLKTINTDQVVGGGFAMCSNKESGKKFFAEYAIASMAQTRATGKAYRLLLGWVMKLAGYEACNAEEMDSIQNAEVVEEKKPKTVKQEPGLVTSEQKAEIVQLLAHGLITNEERNKMTLNLNKLTVERAKEAIINLNNKIEERESAIAHQIAEEQAA